MIKYLKINLVYFFSKKNILIVSICLFIILLINLFIIFSNNNLSMNNLEIITYSLDSVYSFNKIIVVILSCFLINNFILSINDNYKVLFIINSRSNTIFYISKIITVVIVLFCFVFLSFTIYITINTICNKKFILTMSCVKGYCAIYLLSIVYGMISLICTKIIDNTICIIIPITIYICSEFFEFNNSIINTFFPNFMLADLNNEFYIVIIQSILVSLFYLIIFNIIVKD